MYGYGYSIKSVILGGGGVAPFVGLLDLYPAAAAYSLRRLSSTYTGNLIRVRRLIDNAEQNIGYNSSNVLDTAALLSFVGASSGFITTWFDQSGNGQNATQTVAISQPRIVNLGTLDTLNSKPVIRNPNNNVSRPLISSLNYIQNLPVTVIFTAKVNTMPLSGQPTFYVGGASSAGGGGRYELAALSSFSVIRRNEADALAININSFSTIPFIHQGIFRASELTGRVNGIDAPTPTSYSGVPYTPGGGFHLLSVPAAQFNSDISAYECIIYLSDQHANRVGIESNINTFYTIY
jgi:hypothetical protein